jgi:hypothetical protein
MDETWFYEDILCQFLKQIFHIKLKLILGKVMKYNQSLLLQKEPNLMMTPESLTKLFLVRPFSTSVGR